MENKKNKVFESYNIIADWFAENRYQGLMEKAYLDKIIEILGKGSSILDLGCGTGMPMMGYLLSQGMQVAGVDASHRMLEIAKNNLPFTDFQLADMRELSLGKKFDAIIAWHSFFHLPSDDQPAMFDVFKEHLNPGGILMFTSGKELGEAWGMNGGENLFHASLDKALYKSLLEMHGFQVLEYKEDDPDCGNATIWMVQLH
ncbi:class I SAM-dependent methyltransferase [Pedobacter sp. HMWF019]|uniref:class I SAM-dependent methyltransferase n=1 Tax=Pedobacter sp. HMWF019 TaxID=2056856 RepID=UPI000D334A82|nr:class I SAM-dependent methyltransferase [Pedobacter sp. HMWF019]PTS91931.1 class I SAM-dependent methyltransferase [Pedobacter sp. HMWF019]